MTQFKKTLLIFNGPCQGNYVDTAPGASFGDACALPWTNQQGKQRFAVYLLVEHQGQQGMMFLKSYETAFGAQQKVQELSMVAAVMREKAARDSVPLDVPEETLEPSQIITDLHSLS